MKQLILTSILFSMSISSALTQFNCDSIHVNASTVYINQATDNLVIMDYAYDMNVNEMVYYPSFEIVLDDTSDIVFHDFYSRSMLGSGELDYSITYKNMNIPNGTTVTGTFDISGNTNTEGIACSFPLTFIFQEPLSLQENNLLKMTTVYPNPSNGDFTIQLNEQQPIIDATIKNSIGEIVWNSEYHSVSSFELKLNEPAGIYFLVLHAENEATKVLKIMIE